MQEILSGNLIGILVTIVLSLSMLFILKTITDFNFNRHIKLMNTEMFVYDHIKANNVALGIRRGAMYLGLMIGAMGTLNSEFLIQIKDQFLLLIFIGMAFFISDKILFKNVSNTLEIIKGNVAIAIGEAGLFLATGIIAYASFSGEGPWYSSIVFFILGQIVLLLATKAYEFMYPEIKNKIEKGSVASAIMLSSLLISFALILKSSIIGDFTSWETDIISFVKMSILGFVLLVIFANIIIDKLFLPNLTIKEALKKETVAAIILISGLKIGIAVIINTAI